MAKRPKSYERSRHEDNLEKQNDIIEQQISIVKWTRILAIGTIILALVTISISLGTYWYQEQKDDTVILPGTAQNIGDNSLTIPLLNQYSTSNKAIIECIDIETTETIMHSPTADGIPFVTFPPVNVSSCGQYTNINITTFPNKTSDGLLKKEFFQNYLFVDSDKPTNLEIYYGEPYPHEINDHSIIMSIIPPLSLKTSKFSKIKIHYHPANKPNDKKTTNFIIFFGKAYNQPITFYDGESDNFENFDNQKLAAWVGNVN